MKIKIDFSRYDDDTLSRELSRALLYWKQTGKEQDYAELIFKEWKYRFYSKYHKSNNVHNVYWQPS